MIYLGLVIVHLASVFSGSLLSRRFFSIKFIDRLPVFSLKLFLAELVVIMGGISVLIISRLIQANSEVLSGGIWMLSNLVVLIVGVLIFAGLISYIRDVGIVGYQDFLELQSVEAGRLMKGGVSLVLVLGSYTVLFLGYILFQFVLASDGFLVLRLSGLLILGAVLYFPVGVMYQMGRFLLEMKKLIVRSSPVEFDSEYEIRKTYFEDSDSTVYFAATVSTGIDEFILLSEDLITDFEEDTLRAVVAHEASHIQNQESRIVLLVVLGSLLTFVGRNLYYGLFDFRGREFRADREAADEVGPEPVIRALEMFEQNSTEEGGITGVGIASFGGDLNQPEGFDSYFDLFFGDYAIREAHPEIGDRIELLEENK
jgi:Zn-dependent protease with chaperone function